MRSYDGKAQTEFSAAKKPRTRELAATDSQGVLGLQRSIGNRAVTQLMVREKGEYEQGVDVGVALQRVNSSRSIGQRKSKSPLLRPTVLLDFQRQVGNRAIADLVRGARANPGGPLLKTTPVVIQRNTHGPLDTHPRLKALAKGLPEGSIVASDTGVATTDELGATVDASMQSVHNVGTTITDPASPDFSQVAASTPDAAIGLLGAAGGAISGAGNLAVTVLYGKGVFDSYKKYKKGRKTAITRLKEAPNQDEEAKQAAQLADTADELAKELDDKSLKYRVLAETAWDNQAKEKYPDGYRAKLFSQQAEHFFKKANELEGQARTHMEESKQYRMQEEQHKANAEAARELAAEEAGRRGEYRGAAFVNAQGAAAGTLSTATSFASTVGHSTQGALQIAAMTGTAASGALTTAGTMAGGATAVVLGPMAAAMSAYNTYKQTTSALKAGDKRRNAFNFQAAKDKWEKLRKSIPEEIAKLEKQQGKRQEALGKLASANKAHPKRKGKLEDEILWLKARLRYKIEELKLVIRDLAFLDQIGKDPTLVDFSEDEQKEGKKKGHRSVWGDKESQEKPPENVAQIVGFYHEKKGRAEWRAWTEAAGSTVQTAGSLASTMGGVLTIAGAAGMGAGAVPGLVVCAVGGATSLTGTAISSVSYGNKLSHAIGKSLRGTKGTARTTMAKYLVAFAAGRRAPDNQTALSDYAWIPGQGAADKGLLESKDKEQTRAWGFMANQALVPGLTSYTAIKEAVEKGNEFSDKTKVAEIEQKVAESFKSTS
jgi:hypothetical protein